MTIKEYYDALSDTNKRILTSINTNIMNNVWTSSGITNISAYLDGISQEIFFYNFNKDVSPIVEAYLEMFNIELSNMTSAQNTLYIRFLFSKYFDKWMKLWTNVFRAEYNPLWNVEGSETTERWFDHGKTVTETKDFTIEHGRDSTDTETVTDNITDNDVYGFNSATPVGASKSTNNGERTTEYTGSDTDTHSGTDTFANSGRDHEKTEFTRGLNLGMMSTQNLMEQELRLREIFNYFEIVAKDVIRELAVNVY